jgi:dTDP-4-dehydrorhamnose reductase
MERIRKVVIFGNKGMLGTDLSDLIKNDYEVVGFDIDDCDITNREHVLKTLSHILPDLVINCAAYTDVDGCETHVQRAFSVNADGNLFLSEACKEYGIKLVFVSTDYIFNGNKLEPYTEDDEPDPLSIYGRSKLKGEMYVSRTFSNFICIRTSGLYGLNGRSFVKAILDKTKTNKIIKVVNDQMCCPTYTRDLSSAIKDIIKSEYCGVLNVVNPFGCSWFDFAKMIISISKIKDVEVVPFTSLELGLPAKRPSNSILSILRLEDDFGIKMRNQVAALEDFLKEFGNRDSL